MKAMIFVILIQSCIFIPTILSMNRADKRQEARCLIGRALVNLTEITNKMGLPPFSVDGRRVIVESVRQEMRECGAGTH